MHTRRASNECGYSKGRSSCLRRRLKLDVRDLADAVLDECDYQKALSPVTSLATTSLAATGCQCCDSWSDRGRSRTTSPDSIAHLPREKFWQFRCSVPSTAEQRAIAEALSDVDALLGGLDRLIAKKRDLKQAAMQQLLTGQTRLPGFHGEWEVKHLASCSISAAAIQRHATNCHQKVKCSFITVIFMERLRHSLMCGPTIRTFPSSTSP